MKTLEEELRDNPIVGITRTLGGTLAGLIQLLIDKGVATAEEATAYMESGEKFAEVEFSKKIAALTASAPCEKEGGE